MEVYRTQLSRNRSRYLVLTDPDFKTGAPRAVVADVEAQTVQRVKSLPALLRTQSWQAPAPGSITLDTLVRQVPALRPYRGIELRLAPGKTAWIRWRAWSSSDEAVQRLLAETTRQITVPAYEPDADYFLASYAAEVTGGEVTDLPRSVLILGEEAY